MLILIGIVPAHFALDNSINPLDMKADLIGIETAVNSIDSSRLSVSDRHHLFTIQN
jgi:hypothetical protein